MKQSIKNDMCFMFIRLVALLVTQSIHLLLLLGDVRCDDDVDDDEIDDDNDDYDGDDDNDDNDQEGGAVGSEYQLGIGPFLQFTQLSPSAICRSLSSLSSIIIFASDIYLAISLSF